MILGAGIYQLPAIKTAKKLGYEVITVDNIPDNVGHKLSDFSENVSTVDANGVLNVAKKHKIDGIMTIASDIAVLTVAYVGNKLHLPTITLEQAAIFSSKPRFKQFLFLKHFNVPVFKEVKCLKDAEALFNELGGPLFIKPSDRSGSKGVARINSLNELMQKFPTALGASLIGSVCVERFLEGVEVGCEAFCFGGKVAVIVITNKKMTDQFVVCGHSVPSDLSPDKINQVEAMVEKVIKALDINWGPVNLDIMITKNGLYVIDIGARLGGNGLPQIVGFSTGIDTVKMAIEVALGEKPSVPVRINDHPAGVRIFGTARKAILISYADFGSICSRFPEVIELVMDYHPGQKVNAFSEGKNRIGHVIVECRPEQNADLILDLIEQKLNFQYASY
ncbi:MAG: ATP-grasp domain-containing protein [Bacteroidales bacterium]